MVKKLKNKKSAYRIICLFMINLMLVRKLNFINNDFDSKNNSNNDIHCQYYK